jgi:hypothetical protein
MSHDTAPRLPRPTLHAAYYVNWYDVCHAAELTMEEIQEAEAILEHHYTWGDAEITLADAEIVHRIVEEALRAVTTMTDTDRRDLFSVVEDALRGAAFVNLEA